MGGRGLGGRGCHSTLVLALDPFSLYYPASCFLISPNLNFDTSEIISVGSATPGQGLGISWSLYLTPEWLEATELKAVSETQR